LDYVDDAPTCLDLGLVVDVSLSASRSLSANVKSFQAAAG
jgi:hypothetical protein